MASQPTEDIGTTNTIGTMSTSFSSSITTDGGYDYELLGTDPDSRYECPICLLYLRDPVLTTCGHRFCESCIGKWVIKEGGRCPVDGVHLEYENIFPDNFTRREIMQCKAKCPYSKDGCTIITSLAEIERHIQIDHIGLANDISPGPSSKVNGTQTYNGVVECLYKDVGCVSYFPQEQLQRHLEVDVHHHLQLLTAAYKRLKRPHGHELFMRQDSRESTRWLLGDTDTIDSDEYQFRRQRSWDSVRFARKFSTRPKYQDKLAESDESLTCKAIDLPGNPGKLENQSGSLGSLSNGKSNHLKDIYERLVKLEQTDRENKIKIERLESQLSSTFNLFSTINRLTDDLTARYCHGIFVWKIHGFRKLCSEMRKNSTRVLYSPGFYTGTFEYKLCLRFNVTIPTVPPGACSQPEFPPLENDDESFASLYIHFMQGEFDDTLKWPFEGDMKLMIIHPLPEKSIIESMQSKPGGAAFGRPKLPRNSTGIGYHYFSPLSKLFSAGYVNNDTLACKICVKAHDDIDNELPQSHER